MAAAAVALQHQSVSVVVVKLLSLGVSGFLVGVVTAYTTLWIPTVLSAATSAQKMSLWRVGYRNGFHTSRLLSATVLLLWLATALLTPSSSATLPAFPDGPASPSSHDTRSIGSVGSAHPASYHHGLFSAVPPKTFYLLAATITPSIIPFTILFQRTVNGALCRRARQLIGPPGIPLMCDTYSVDDRAAERYEQGKSTEALIRAWGCWNAWRAVIAAVGTGCGVVGLVGEIVG